MTRRTRAPYIKYSDVELAWLEANCTLVIDDYHAAFCAEFHRTDVSAQNLNGLRKRKGWRTGRTGRFVTGNAPHNLGVPCRDGHGGRHPNAKATQFRKGLVPHNQKQIGDERVGKDGYMMISVAETNPWTGHSRRFVHKHRWLWEQKNGPLPKGHALKCLDGDRLNTDPDNWTAVPRALLPRLAGRASIPYDSAHPDLKPALLSVAKLRHALKQGRTKGGAA